MFVLIPGITGNLGHHLASSALKDGHSIRGLGRTPSKLDLAIRSHLESFILTGSDLTEESYDTACQGVYIIVNAWSPLPHLLVDAQLRLLRAAERSGVKRFHAASWNYDWENLKLNEIET